MISCELNQTTTHVPLFNHKVELKASFTFIPEVRRDFSKS